MPDLWDDLPTEMFGDRPPAEILSKDMKRPKEVQNIEKGSDATPNRGVFGSPEVK